MNNKSPTPSEHRYERTKGIVGWTFGAERPGGEAPAAAMGDPGPKVLTSRALGSRGIPPSSLHESLE